MMHLFINILRIAINKTNRNKSIEKLKSTNFDIRHTQDKQQKKTIL